MTEHLRAVQTDAIAFLWCCFMWCLAFVVVACVSLSCKCSAIRRGKNEQAGNWDIPFFFASGLAFAVLVIALVSPWAWVTAFNPQLGDVHQKIVQSGTH